jgi:hypothetical protein
MRQALVSAQTRVVAVSDSETSHATTWSSQKLPLMDSVQVLGASLRHQRRASLVRVVVAPMVSTQLSLGLVFRRLEVVEMASARAQLLAATQQTPMWS